MATTQGTGSIIQMEKDKPKNKCRKWQLRVSLGRDPKTGKYHQKTRMVNGSYSKAKAELRAFIEEIEEDRVQSRTSWTFGAYCDYFLEQRELKKEIAKTTLERQRGHFKAACMHIGAAKLESITPAMLNSMYIALLKGETPSGRKVDGSYVNCIHDNIKLVFDLAIKEGILTENPCLKSDPPKMDTKPKKAISPDAVHVMIAMLDETKARDMAYLIAVTMGLRRGEICGLSWKDIDFDRGIVDISHSFDAYGNLKQTKTKAGMRLLPLSDNMCESLLKFREAQKAQFDRTNSFRHPWEGYIEIDENFPVIATKYGTRVNPATLSTWWTKDRAKFGLEGFTLHELRHTYLTLLAMNGVHPKVMQELAGHYSSQITMDIYTHVNMDAKREAVAAVSKVF